MQAFDWNRNRKYTTRRTDAVSSTPTHMTKHPRDWTEFERASFARARIAEAIVRLIDGGTSYDEATAIAFAEVNRRWPNLLAAMIRDDRERRGLDYAKVEAV